jgi:hypothetical protein
MVPFVSLPFFSQTFSHSCFHRFQDMRNIVPIGRFLLSGAAKAFLLGAGFVAFCLLPRGITGLVQRMPSAIRTLRVVPLWTAHFSGNDVNPKPVLSLASLSAKMNMHLWLLADFGIAFRDYIGNAQDGFVSVFQQTGRRLNEGNTGRL